MGQAEFAMRISIRDTGQGRKRWLANGAMLSDSRCSKKVGCWVMEHRPQWLAAMMAATRMECQLVSAGDHYQCVALGRHIELVANNLSSTFLNFLSLCFPGT